MLVIVGGSGVGKSGSSSALLQRSDRFAFLADTTTRARGDRAARRRAGVPATADFVSLRRPVTSCTSTRSRRKVPQPSEDEYYGVEWSVLYDAAVGKVCCSGWRSPVDMEMYS